jgi:hypothetical protein
MGVKRCFALFFKLCGELCVDKTAGNRVDFIADFVVDFIAPLPLCSKPMVSPHRFKAVFVPAREKRLERIYEIDSHVRQKRT